MEINPTFGKFTVYASDYCKLDSDVLIGGGTNETDKIQKILDKAKDWGHIHLIMDGAALISGIKIHSNTTIECLDSSCGFFLESGSDNAVIRNANFSKTEFTAVNITLKGGTYNHNCLGQSPDFPLDDQLPEGENCRESLVAFKFFGVKNLKIQDLTLLDQKRYGMLIGNWEDVYMENIDIPLPHLIERTNQDGLHFHGPGKNLVLKNIHGRGGDDFIAINGDEGDRVSSIDGVLIDGVYFKDSTQGIRILCRERGTVENITIRNIYGSVDSYLFFINPFFHSTHRSPDFEGYSGTFKNISIENVSVTMKNPTYKGTNQGVFHLGGDIENISIRNVSARSNQDGFRLLAIREGHAVLWDELVGASPTNMKEVFIDRVFVKGTDETVKFESLFAVEGVTKVDRLTIKNVTAENIGNNNPFLTIAERASVNELNLDFLRLTGFERTLKIDGKCNEVNETNIKLV